jgi:hypothetical protein
MEAKRLNESWTVSKDSARNQGMEALAETPMKQGEGKAKPFFTKENAKLYAIQATEARKQAAIRRQEQLEKSKEVTALEPSELYRLNRLARIRAQLALVDSEIEKAIKEHKPDQNRLKSLVDAQIKLSQQEQKLDNRPDPGSYRPRTPSTKQSSTGFAPIEE